MTLFWLILAAIVVAVGAAGFTTGAYRRHPWRDAGIIGAVPALGYAGYMAWLYTWQAGCSDCLTAGGEDSRETVFLLNVIYYGFALLIMLAAIGVFAALGYALSPRRRRPAPGTNGT